MADWRDLVRERLAGLALSAEEKDDVQTELAGHLHESYEALRAAGLTEQESACRTLAQVPDWQDLQRKVLIAKRGVAFMKKRVQQLWIPGFLTLILSTFSLMAAQTGGFQPRVIGSGPKTILFYVPWLVSLPFFGALGAYVSLRAGGSRRIVLLASIFPVLALGTAFLLMFPIGMIIEKVTGNGLDFGIVATALLSDGIGWLLVPGAALLAGGLLPQLYFPRRLTSRSIASH